jgi:hypothetical protein
LDGDGLSAMMGCCSAIVFFWHRLDLPNSPGAITSLPLQGLYLPKKLRREPHFSPKSFIAGIAAQALLHVACSGLKGSYKDA